MKVLYFVIRRMYYRYVRAVRKVREPALNLFCYGEIADSDLARFESELLYHFGAAPVINKRRSLGLLTRLKMLIAAEPVMVLGKEYRPLDRAWFNVFNIDVERCHVAAWSWHQLLTFVKLRDVADEVNPRRSYDRFFALKESLTRYRRAYVFGTGPSLIACMDMDFSDGIRIACNTMVKSDRIWSHLKPHIVVAGDAIHHFSNTEYARRFRSDLARRLRANPDLVFLYPQDFHAFAGRVFKEFANQLIPMGNSSNTNPFRPFGGRLNKAANENVLTMLQLPVAANLAKTIDFLGFDGRGKADTGFWKSSSEYNYVDEMGELRKAFPAFFYYYLEKNKDKDAYVKKVHGEALERNMQKAEAAGYRLRSLAPSNTPTFQHRYHGPMRTENSHVDRTKPPRQS